MSLSDVHQFGAYLTPFCHRYRFCDENCEVPGLFLDRDGVVIDDMHYISRPEDVRLSPGAKEVFDKAMAYDIPIIIVTNQSGISRGITTWDSYHRVTYRMLELLNYPTSLKAIYANSHGPQIISSYWRKPNPGMILRAAQDYALKLENSVIIGDRTSDIEAAYRSGIRNFIHVKTGHGVSQREDVVKWYYNAKANLAEARGPSLKLIESLADSVNFIGQPPLN